MARLSLGTAWDEAASFVKRHAGLLFPLAFVMIAVPAAILSAVTPPGERPPAGPWMLVGVAVFVLSLAGQIALTWLVLGRNVSVGEAIGRGFRRFLPLFGAMLLVGLALAAAALFVIILLVLLMPGVSANVESDQAAQARLIGILMIVLAPLILYVGARMIPLTPVAAAESGGPITLLRRALALSAGHVWRLIGFILLAALLAIVVSLAAASVGQLAAFALAGEIRQGSISSFVVLFIGAVIHTVITVYVAAIVARIYVQLAGASASVPPTSGT